jgi:hypothetical protein
MTNIAETRVTETPTPFSFLPNVYDCVVGDYITYATRVERTTKLAWGRLQEDTSREMNRFFVQNELDGSMLYHYFSDKLDVNSKFAYRFPDEEMNVLLRELPLRSIKEMLGLYEERNEEESKRRDIFGSPIEAGDLVTFVSRWSGLKLAQVETVSEEGRPLPINVRTLEKNAVSMRVPSDAMALVPVSTEARSLIRAMSPEALFLHYWGQNKKRLVPTKLPKGAW